MRRKLFTLCSAASLLLCVAVCVLWVRSYFVSFDGIGFMRHDGAAELVHRLPGGSGDELWRVGPQGLAQQVTYAGSERGVVVVAVLRQRHAPGHLVQVSIPEGRVAGRGRWELVPDREWLGFGFEAGRSWRRWDRTLLTVPHWALALILTALPAAQLRRSIRDGRFRDRSRRLCPACGYDLRASPDRCPECGAVPT